MTPAAALLDRLTTVHSVCQNCEQPITAAYEGRAWFHVDPNVICHAAEPRLSHDDIERACDEAAAEAEEIGRENGLWKGRKSGWAEACDELSSELEDRLGDVTMTHATRDKVMAAVRAAIATVEGMG